MAAVTPPEPQAERVGRSRPSLLLLVIAVVLVLLALFIGSQVIGVLYGIVAPPAPPLPVGARQETHESVAYGVDDWTYRLDGDPCQVAAFYASRGICEYAPLQCGGALQESGALEQLVARCQGQFDFSIFTTTWDADVIRTYGAGGVIQTELRLEREVYWIGGPGRGPTPTPEVTEPP